MPVRNCLKCSSRFHIKLAHLKMGYGKYCSRECHHEEMRKRIEKKCSICNNKIYRTKNEIERSRSKKYFCNKSCQTKWRNTVFIGEKHKRWKGGGNTYRDILFRTNIPKKCASCGISDKRILAVHHKDCDHKNNKVSNLTWLCHNCHHEVHYGKLKSIIS